MSSTPTDLDVVRFGRAVLTALMTAAVAGTLAIGWVAPPAAMLLVPAAVLSVVVAVLAVRRPVAGLASVLVLSVALMGYGDTANVGEVAFSLYFVLYTAVWYGHRLLSQQPIVRSRTDAAIAGLVAAGLVAGPALGLLMNADPVMLLGEVQAFAMLTLYFPIRETVRSEPGGAAAVAGCFIVAGLAAAAWNGYAIVQAFGSADQLWQIVDVRTAYGEATLAFGWLLSIASLLAARTRGSQIALTLVAAVLLVGLILTKSRGYWAATAAGVGVVLAVLPSEERRTALLKGVALMLAVGAVSVVAFGEYVALIAAGVVNRFTTLGSAATTDASLINRFFESAAAWELIQKNPILGYGMGVPFRRFDIIVYGTINWSFIHNAFVGMWYKLGLWGLVLVCGSWLACIVAAVRAARARALERPGRLLAAGAAGTLVVLAIVANTSNPFQLSDQTLVVTGAFGLAVGLWQRSGR